MAQAMLTKCPTCRKPSAKEYRPFCSARCADIDLGKWLGERYRLETNEGPNDRKSKADEE